MTYNNINDYIHNIIITYIYHLNSYINETITQYTHQITCIFIFINLFIKKILDPQTHSLIYNTQIISSYHRNNHIIQIYTLSKE